MSSWFSIARSVGLLAALLWAGAAAAREPAGSLDDPGEPAESSIVAPGDPDAGGGVLAGQPPGGVTSPPGPPAPSLAPGLPLLPVPPPPPPECKAASAILVDATTGTILWEKDAHVRRAQASTTKIMTTLLLLESGRLDDMVQISDHARATEYASLNAKPGEKLPMRDLLYAIMLRSSNDGCVAAAEHVSGQAWKFVRQMTEKARAIGAYNTHFVTTNGLYHPQHYSTAYDLALITRYASQNPIFNQVTRTRKYWLRRSQNMKDRLVKNHNKLLDRYFGADGVKTGYVRQSGRCLVASSTRPEGDYPWRLIAVVLNSPDTYGDCANLMDWGRKYFQPVVVAHRGQPFGAASVLGGLALSVPLVAARDLVVLAPRGPVAPIGTEVESGSNLPPPIQAYHVAGRLRAVAGGQTLNQVDLVTDRPVEVAQSAAILPWTAGILLLAALVFGPRYARAITKSYRRRRNRFAPRSRKPDPQRQGIG